MFRTIRRSLVILPIALGILATTAVSASAAPLSCSASTGSSNLTALNICVDVSGTNRAVYVQGTTTLPSFAVTLTIHSSDLWQYSASTGWGDASQDGYWQATGVQTVTYTGTPFTV